MICVGKALGGGLPLFAMFLWPEFGELWDALGPEDDPRARGAREGRARRGCACRRPPGRARPTSSTNSGHRNIAAESGRPPPRALPTQRTSATPRPATLADRPRPVNASTTSKAPASSQRSRNGAGTSAAHVRPNGPERAHDPTPASPGSGPGRPVHTPAPVPATTAQTARGTFEPVAASRAARCRDTRSRTRRCPAGPRESSAVRSAISTASSPVTPSFAGYGSPLAELQPSTAASARSPSAWTTFCSAHAAAIPRALRCPSAATPKPAVRSISSRPSSRTRRGSPRPPPRS